MADSPTPQDRFYFDRDADLTHLRGRTVSIIGYGNQGRSQALNLRDSGIEVVVGSQRDTSFDRARDDGFEPLSVPEAVRAGQIVVLLVPDEVMPSLYGESVAPHLSPGEMLVFASGYNVYFGFISPPAHLDVVLLAPRMIGKGVRDRFLDGRGFPSLVGVHQDATGRAWSLLLALAKGIGSTRAGALKSSFEEETILDLFSEHALAGVRLWSIRTAFDVLREYGIGPSAILLELYASGEAQAVTQAAADLGLWDQLLLHSRTSQYGQLTRGQAAATEETRRHFRSIVDQIRDGRFAREWTQEQEAGFPVMRRLMEMAFNHESVKAEKRLFEMMRKKQG
ncbi:MAG: ketol-acid reductoisomerase [Deltaproteobacteria bacterium]|nr:ketol-acid reductoisomerase [Deltaproteobacteria bacterium]MBW2120419.1 ketol-acid reductoisomerase [Deltaproteobacteria bacterium]